MDFSLSEEHIMRRDTIRRFCEREHIPELSIKGSWGKDGGDYVLNG